MKPDDFEMTLAECPPGFFLFKDMVGFKSEYGTDSYCDTGEFFHGNVPGVDRNDTLVIPLIVVIEDEKL